MKKIYTLALAILATTFSFAQTVETFDGVTFPGSYSNGSVTLAGTG